jgi:hypothetical protein
MALPRVTADEDPIGIRRLAAPLLAGAIYRLSRDLVVLQTDHRGSTNR